MIKTKKKQNYSTWTQEKLETKNYNKVPNKSKVKFTGKAQIQKPRNQGNQDLPFLVFSLESQSHSTVLNCEHRSN